MWLLSRVLVGELESVIVKGSYLRPSLSLKGIIPRPRRSRR